jgi:hypothetical protein
MESPEWFSGKTTRTPGGFKQGRGWPGDENWLARK